MSKKRILVTFFIFLIFSFTPLFSMGAKDNSFYEIDQCIAEKRYNDALLLLNQYILENPKNFDNAQKRINKIMKVRSEYADLAEQVIDVIEFDPTNDEKKLKMIAELEAIEENPSESTKNFISQTKSAAEFTYYKAKFDEILEKGSKEAENYKYVDSLWTNYSGFQLYRTHFHESGYDEEFVQSVEQKLTRIKDTIGVYEGIISNLDVVYNNLVAAVAAGNKQKIEKAYNDFQFSMEEFSLIRNEIADIGWYLRDSFFALKEDDPELTDASFLALAYRFVLGSDKVFFSGMVNALDRHWDYYMEGIKPYVYKQIESHFKLFETVIEDNSFETVIAKNNECLGVLYETDYYITLGINLEGINSFLKQNTTTYHTVRNRVFMKNCEEALGLVTDYKALIDFGKEYNQSLDRLVKYGVPENGAKLVSEKDFEYKELVVNTVRDFIKKQEFSDEIYIRLHRDLNRNSKWVDQYKWLKDFAQISLEIYGTKIDELNSGISGWLKKAGDKIVFDHTKIYDECVVLLNEDMNPDVMSYPKKVQELLDDRIVKIPKDIEALETVITFYDEDLFQYGDDRGAIEADVELLTGLLQQNIEVRDKAKEKIRLAEMAKNEADLRYKQALLAFEQGDYATSREMIEKARGKYNESLLYQESEQLRTESDNMLLTLGEKLINGENEIVVKEVRQLKTNAKNAYYLGNFEVAENILTQAKTRWSETNSVPDNEIESLISLVGTALSMKTGRSIPPTAPLYPEMSQLLNIANDYYNKGKIALANGNKVEAELCFSNAKTKLREVQTVYPLNQEASLLTLRIDQVVDPTAFNDYFKRKVEAAKSDYKDPSKQQTVYTEILDLYEINPSYPGLKDFIYNVEIELGIRVRPPDRTAINKSNSLTKQAEQVFNSGRRNEISLNSALQLVNQALDANPDNTDAQILKDRISTALGGTGTAVLPAVAEKKYQQAVQELQKGNILEAYTIVSELMSNKNYSKSSKVIDLQKKVESLL